MNERGGPEIKEREHQAPPGPTRAGVPNRGYPYPFGDMGRKYWEYETRSLVICFFSISRYFSSISYLYIHVCSRIIF